VWIEVSNIDCRVLQATEEEREWLMRYLSFSDSSWRGRGSDSRITLFKEHRGTFPGGLLPLVRDAASRDAVKIEEFDKRTSRVVVEPAADLAWLRDYQRDAVEACVLHKRGLVSSPTGSGKSEIIIGVTRRLKGRWLFLVHRDGLVDQQAKRCVLRGDKKPNILSRTAPATWQIVPGLNMMTLQSLAAGIRADRGAVDLALQNIDGLIVDEAHVAPADVYYAAIQRCPAEYRFGFSGTPLDRSDNRSLMAIAALGRIIFRIKAQDLIAAGVLAMPQITMVQIKHPAAQVGSSFHDLYDELVVDSELRNNRIVEIVRTATKPCMVFVKQIEHGHALKKALEAARMSVEFVWGSTKSEGRLQAIERLERRDSDVMIASVVFQEGIDIPSLESVVIASGGKSVIAALQRIGRGMRTNGGTKTTFAVFDVLDMGVPMFEKHSRRRMNTYVREGYQTIIQREDGQVARYAPKLLTRREKKARALAR